MSELRVVSPSEEAGNSGAIDEIATAFDAMTPEQKKDSVGLVVERFLVTYSNRHRIATDIVTGTSRARCPAVAVGYNKAVALLRGIALSAAASLHKGKPTTELQKLLIRVVPSLLTVAKGDLRFLAPAPTVSAPAEPVPHTVVMLGTDVDEKDTHPLKISRRRRGADGVTADGKPMSMAVTLGAIESTGATAAKLVKVYRPASAKPTDMFGAWPQQAGKWAYALELHFVNAESGAVIPMLTSSKYLRKAMTDVDPRTRNRTLSASGKIVSDCISAKIKELLRRRDMGATPEQAADFGDVFVTCHVNTCRHSSGFMLQLLPGGHAVTTSRCPGGCPPTCIRCMEKAHHGDCRVMASLDDETRAFIAANSKPCPSCGNATMKIDGCNHMTCRCGGHFCWRCLRRFPATVGWQPHDSGDGVCTMHAGVYGEGEAMPVAVGGGWGGLAGAGAGGAHPPVAPVAAAAEPVAVAVDPAAAARVVALAEALADWDNGLGAALAAMADAELPVAPAGALPANPAAPVGWVAPGHGWDPHDFESDTDSDTDSVDEVD